MRTSFRLVEARRALRSELNQRNSFPALSALDVLFFVWVVYFSLSGHLVPPIQLSDWL